MILTVKSRIAASVIAAAGRGRGRLNRLAVNDGGGRALLACFVLPVEHQRQVVDRAEQQPAHEAAKPPVYRLPWWKVLRQHPPAAARSSQIPQGVQHLAQIRRGLASLLRRRRQEREDDLPLRIRQIGRLALRLLLSFRHPATARSGPHSELDSRMPLTLDLFLNGL